MNNDPINADTSTLSIHRDSLSPGPQAASLERSTINEILQETANQFIDVSALEDSITERPDQKSRAKRYHQKLQLMTPNLLPSLTSPLTFSGPGIAAPASVLQSSPVPQADVVQITMAAERISNAVRSMKANGKDQLVVPLTTYQ